MSLCFAYIYLYKNLNPKKLVVTELFNDPDFDRYFIVVVLKFNLINILVQWTDPASMD